MSEACAWGTACGLMLLLGMGAPPRTYALDAERVAAGWQDRAAVRDTTRPVRFDVDVAAGNSRIQHDGDDAAQFVTFGFMPEFYYGKLGVGLLVRLHVHAENGQMREEDFNDRRDYLALLYFVEYGEESDPGGYGRFGSIEEATLGYGLFVDRYTNEVSIDHPMRGLAGALASDHWRVEGVYSDLAAPGMFGVHAAYFPLGTETGSRTPRLTLGGGVAAELRGRRTFVNPSTPGAPFLIEPPPDGVSDASVPYGVEDGGLYLIGVDAGVRWVHTGRVSLVTFAEAAKIVDYGVGATLGVQGASAFGDVRLGAQYEQRFLGKAFLPDYFGPTYEAERIRTVALPAEGDASLEAVNTRRNELAGRDRPALGFKVEVEGDYADAFEATVGYATIWGTPGSARFHLDLQLHAQRVPVSVRLGYDRFAMESLRDVLVRSRTDALYRLGVAYQIVAPLRVGVEMRQTYEPIFLNGRAAAQRKQSRIEPFVQLVWRF